MQPTHHHAPTPDLRIIPTSAPQPHEEHDSQRAQPLIERLKAAELMTNPPMVTQTSDGSYIILDGANRCFSFAALEIPHILVQVVSYFSGQVELQTWNHVISRWNTRAFLDMIYQLDGIEVQAGQDKNAIAHIAPRNGEMLALKAPVQSVRERNAALREVVRIYQQNAVLNRTPSFEPEDVWHLYPEANALVIFPEYTPGDIIEATRYRAYLPPGISRHIVHGRALQVNYPMDKLKDPNTPLEEKNTELKAWITHKLVNRHVRYYAEATYQFSE